MCPAIRSLHNARQQRRVDFTQIIMASLCGNSIKVCVILYHIVVKVQMRQKCIRRRNCEILDLRFQRIDFLIQLADGHGSGVTLKQAFIIIAHA